MYTFQFFLVIIVCIAIVIPIFNNLFKEGIYKYTKERLKNEMKADNMRKIWANEKENKQR